ncbi:c-type cytochrome [Panacibacter ginsenosidivorans]|uniref:C-type cytochrome n=1 Tax=Panacibacter ginsenosidivorans TaxID=1813871 RepID=A0A5B8VCJ1_9BACT|nr:c-type cytochrome [Panacibacter ginsenosidivorans]QEC68661.1 c-type cytochrome [Panacibacter ginsenosidivorans]
MKPKLSIAFSIMLIAVIIVACNNESAKVETTDTTKEASPTVMFGGFESQAKWGEHIVKIGGCNDCHTPKKMGPNGPEDDMSLMLSGHPAGAPPAPFDAKEAAKKGLIVTQTFTAWTGPWGTTFAANLTPDSTGLGSWKEEQFLKALKEKKWMGLDNTRPLMPPMSMMPVALMTDDELKAIFAYLKTIPPIHNIQPEAVLLPPPPPAK